VLVVDVSAGKDGGGGGATHPSAAALTALIAELAAYDPDLAARPCVVAANKVDAVEGGPSGQRVQAAVDALASAAPAGCVAVIPTSGRTGVGLVELADAVSQAVGRAEDG